MTASVDGRLAAVERAAGESTPGPWPEPSAAVVARAPDAPTENSPVKVLITVPWPWDQRRGGAENLLWMFLRHVDRQRVEPAVVFFKAGAFEREVDALGVTTYVIPGGRMREVRRGLKNARELSMILRREQPDFILNWTSHTHIYSSVAALWTGMGDRLVWWQHGVPGTASDTGVWIERLATLFPARLVVCSSRAGAAAQERLHPKRRTVVVHPGVEPLQKLSASDLRDLRKSLGIPEGDLVIGIVGRLVPWKGQDRFLELLSQLRLHGYPVHGLVVGGATQHITSDFEDKLRFLVKQSGLTGHVTFTGQVQDAGPYFQLFDIAFNLSEGESLSLAILEALSAGKPLVAINTGGTAEILADGDAGVLVPARNRERLYQTVEVLLNDANGRRVLSDRATRTFARDFTARRLASDLERIFNRDLMKSQFEAQP